MSTLEDHHYLKMEPELVRNPYPFYKLLREEGPVYQEPDYGVYVVSRLDEVLEVNRHPEVFSSILVANAPYAELPAPIDQLAEWRANQPYGDKILSNDPPDHTRHKALINRFFTPRRVNALEPRVREVTNQIIDEFIDRGEVEFVKEFAHMLPRMIVGELIGVPEADSRSFRDFFMRRLDLMNSYAAGNTPEIPPDFDVDFLQNYFFEAITERRRNPVGDIMSDLATATFADGEEVPVESVVSMINLLYAAGGDANTPEMMTNGVLVLLNRPDIEAELRANPALCSDFVEEVLRFDNPVLGVFRVALRDTSVGGVQIPKGATVMILYASANHDEAYFDEPEVFALERKSRHQHIGFGHGAHFCPGASLARQEGKVAFQEILRRMGNIRRVADSDVPYVPTVIQRIPAQLKLTFDKLA